MNPGPRNGKLKRTGALVWTPILVMSLVMAGHGPLTPASAGDVNDDGAVDVLDLQRLVAEVLGPAGGAIADLNRDGSIDILDLQLVLAEAAQTGQTAPDAPDDGPPPAVTGASGTAAWPTPGRPLVAFLPANFRPDSGKAGLREARPRIPRDIERYLFTLTPNAPPHRV